MSKIERNDGGGQKQGGRPINEERIEKGLGGGNLQAALQKPAQKPSNGGSEGKVVLNESTRRK